MNFIKNFINICLKKRIWLPAAVIAVLYLWHLGCYGLIDPDEGRYADVPREMLASGDFITPHLNGVEFFDKPALQYWAEAFFMAVFGPNEFAARLFPALCALGGIAVSYRLGCEMFGRRTGIRAAVMLASSILYFIIGSINILDMAVSFFITLAMASYYLFSVREGRAAQKYLCLFYAAMALGVLTKGLIALVLPGIIIALYIVLTKQYSLLRRSVSLPGLLIFAAVAVPWFYLVCRDNPDFFYYFFIEEHFLRYATRMYNRFQPWYFFLPCLILGVFPWTGYMLASLKKIFKNPFNLPRSQIYLLLWTGVIFLFYSASSSKLVPYIVPCIAPLILLTASKLDDLVVLKPGIIINSIASLIFLAAFIIAAVSTDFIEVDELVHSGLPLLAILTITPALTLRFCSQKKYAAALKTSLIAGLLLCFSLQPLISAVAGHRTGKDTAQIVSQWKSDDTVLIGYKDHLRSLPFYTGSRIMLYSCLGELEFGSKHPDGQGWFLNDPNELRRIWQSNPDVIIVIPKKLRSDAGTTLDLTTARTAETEKYIIVKKIKKAAVIN